MDNKKDSEFTKVIERLMRNRRDLTPEEIAQRNAEESEAARRELEERLRVAKVPKRFWGITFQEIERRGVPDNTLEQFILVRSYADEIKVNIRSGKGLLLAGTPGTLKTTFATAVLRVAIELEYGALFVRMPGLIDLTTTLMKTDRVGYAEFEKRLRSIPLLLLDDFGAEGTEKWIATKVDGIITDRWHDEKATILTTNLAAQELKLAYSDRVIDRLRSSCKTVLFSGPSQRPKA